MAWWLLKTDPDTYGWALLEKDGTTRWDGVTNVVALKNIAAAKRGDRVIIYHTGKDKAAIGVAEVMSDPYPDPKEARLSVFDIAARDKLARPVGLDEMKASALFKDSPLVRQGRLSVVPLEAKQARWIVERAKKS